VLFLLLHGAIDAGRPAEREGRTHACSSLTCRVAVLWLTQSPEPPIDSGPISSSGGAVSKPSPSRPVGEPAGSARSSDSEPKGSCTPDTPQGQSEPEHIARIAMAGPSLATASEIRNRTCSKSAESNWLKFGLELLLASEEADLTLCSSVRTLRTTKHLSTLANHRATRSSWRRWEKKKGNDRSGGARLTIAREHLRVHHL
jgi:hypothetical protein